MPSRPSQAAPPPDRRQRADGARSRQAILKAATELATSEGLDGLTIGRLADHVGMSKSGLFAHFRSKEDLQMATIDAGAALFDREVWLPGLEAPPGLARVQSQCEAFFSYLERGVLSGGCFFVAAAAELDAKPGPVRDHFLSVYTALLQRFTDLVAEAQELGEIRATEDVAQLTFELDAFLVGANFAHVFFGDPAALGRAREAVRRRLDQARVPPRASAPRAPRARRAASR